MKKMYNQPETSEVLLNAAASLLTGSPVKAAITPANIGTLDATGGEYEVIDII